MAPFQLTGAWGLVQALAGVSLLCIGCAQPPGQVTETGEGGGSATTTTTSTTTNTATAPPSANRCDSSSTAAQPFGTHVGYAAGILPDHVSQGELDSAVRSFYDIWKARYVATGCGDGRHYIAAPVSGDQITVSEAHGYGMMIAALMAGHDAEAHTIFDGLYRYFVDHPSSGSPDLMAWSQGLSCDSNHGPNSASDGDLDIAYGLLLANKQWGSGAIDYFGEAYRVASAILAADVEPQGRYVLLGDWATPDSGDLYDMTRSSDFMPQHFASFAAAFDEDRWNTLTDHGYQMMASLQQQYAPATGLVPDFIRSPESSPYPAPGGFEGPNDGAYGHNACRVPWRVAVHYLASADQRARSVVEKMNTWVVGSTGGYPSEIMSGYWLDGDVVAGGYYTSMAFTGPLAVAAMTDTSNQAWLNTLWEAMKSDNTPNYYDDTLKLLAMLAVSDNWWAPESVPCPP